MREAHDPDRLRPPIELDRATNDAVAPVPRVPAHRHARARAFARVTDSSGTGRR